MSEAERSDNFDMTPAVTVVVVAFNSGATIRACLQSVPSDCDVVVVDQRSSDDTVEVVHQTRPDATVIRNERNSGYSAGCNLGARNARGASLVFLNPDATFLTPDAPRILASSAQAANALVAPIVVDPDHSDVTLVRRWTTAGAQARKLVTLQRQARVSRSLSEPQDEYVSGPCLAISARNFQAVGGFDDRFFLYREEETLARRLENIGVGRLLDQQVTVLHIGGVSTSQVPEFAFRQALRSEILFCRLHFPSSAAALLTLLLAARMLIGSVIAPLLRRLRVRPGAHPAVWYVRALAEVPGAWRGQPATTPEDHRCFGSRSNG
jgi:N-acetylglucosaminyl-diphospho-decaprenol L-rhamnosyltransferase